MKDIQFLLIDNANFGSIVIDHIKTEFPIINEKIDLQLISHRFKIELLLIFV